MNESHLEELAETIKTSRKVAALTGAGVSVASGIPDFRSEEGLWTRYDPSIYASFQKFMTDPSYFWEMHIDVMALLRKAQPNPAHQALAVLEETEILQGVITQNIDGLHQKAGSQTVYELHGTNETCSCSRCGKKYDTEQIADNLFKTEKDELIAKMRSGEQIPTCECGGWIKPDVVLFGEMMPVETLRAAKELAAFSDLLLMVGSSLQVQPAASLPFFTRRNGGILAIINDQPTPLDAVATHTVRGKAEKVLPYLVLTIKQ